MVEVRDALAAWFQPPAIDGLQAMYRAMPWFAAGSTWELSENSGYGAIGYIHFNDIDETRIAYGGPTGGIKQVGYTVGLVLLYQYLVPPVLGPDEDQTAWLPPLERILADTVARIREDRTFGTGDGGAIWQAGEDANDIRMRQDIPTPLSGAIHSWNVIEFRVVENVFS